ncbi:MAG: hypothetical protein IH602_21645 [Bryobacteraceae bacterium]|nr:hypothetical protein [Bryobacteraceae bacterium]
MDGLYDVRAANTIRIPRTPGGAKGSGLNLVFAPCGRLARASVRPQTLEVPAQIVATRDDVAVKLDEAICFRGIDARMALPENPGFLNSISNLAQTVPRYAMGDTTRQVPGPASGHEAPPLQLSAGDACLLLDLEPLRNSDELPWPKQ